MNSLPSTRRPVNRSVRILARPDADGRHAVLAITVQGKTTEYLVDRVVSDWGRCYAVANLTNGNHYSVMLEEDGRTCDCKGFCRWGHCRHADGILALVKAGRI